MPINVVLNVQPESLKHTSYLISDKVGHCNIDNFFIRVHVLTIYFYFPKPYQLRKPKNSCKYYFFVIKENQRQHSGQWHQHFQTKITKITLQIQSVRLTEVGPMW